MKTRRDDRGYTKMRGEERRSNKWRQKEGKRRNKDINTRKGWEDEQDEDADGRK